MLVHCSTPAFISEDRPRLRLLLLLEVSPFSLVHVLVLHCNLGIGVNFISSRVRGQGSDDRSSWSVSVGAELHFYEEQRKGVLTVGGQFGVFKSTVIARLLKPTE
jgi:hypothetical protein